MLPPSSPAHRETEATLISVSPPARRTATLACSVLAPVVRQLDGPMATADTLLASGRGCGSVHHMDVTLRPARPGDGADLARGWLDGCRYYAALDPERFQVPDDDG